MTFLAIVHAPALRPGARLSIADLAQTLEGPPARLAPGAKLDLRFGTCCPNLACGAILGCNATADEAVLGIAGFDYTIRRCRKHGGVEIPGLVAEDWFVIDG